MGIDTVHHSTLASWPRATCIVDLPTHRRQNKTGQSHAIEPLISAVRILPVVGPNGSQASAL
jgi:hypothetical protein